MPSLDRANAPHRFEFCKDLPHLCIQVARFCASSGRLSPIACIVEIPKPRREIKGGLGKCDRVAELVRRNLAGEIAPTGFSKGSTREAFAFGRVKAEPRSVPPNSRTEQCICLIVRTWEQASKGNNRGIGLPFGTRSNRFARPLHEAGRSTKTEHVLDMDLNGISHSLTGRK
jgi:hypothetical protein